MKKIKELYFSKDAKGRDKMIKTMFFIAFAIFIVILGASIFIGICVDVNWCVALLFFDVAGLFLCSYIIGKIWGRWEVEYKNRIAQLQAENERKQKFEQEKIEAEQKLKEREEEKKEGLRIVKEIIKFIKIFEVNDQLNVIIDNFINKNRKLSFELDAIPLVGTKNDEDDNSDDDENFNLFEDSYSITDRRPAFCIEDLKTINNDDYKKIKFSLEFAYKIWEKDKRCFDSYEHFPYLYGGNCRNEIEKLYSSIQKGNIEKSIKNISNMRPFVIYLNEKYRKEREQQYDELVKKFNLDKNETFDEKVLKLESENIIEDDIEYFMALDCYFQNPSKRFAEAYDDAQGQFEDYKEAKKYLKLLMPKNRKKTQKEIMEEVDAMTGSQFETFIAKLFKELGYQTSVTKTSGDQGIDVLAIKNNVTLAIQAKCYSGVVGNHAIMEAVAGMKYYNADKCLVVTNSKFTKSAIKLAKANDVELWDREKLKENIDDTEVTGE